MKTRNPLVQHIIVGTLSALLLLIFWKSRPTWSADMRLWRAFGDAGLVLLILALSIGPLARLRTSAVVFMKWRRPIGIWFALLSLVHAVLILNGWVNWSVLRLLGYEFISQVDRYARLEPGFGLANILGLVALFWTLVLGATSTQKMVRFLGGGAWRWLHGGAYVIFYLTAAHVMYFLFIHFTLSFHRSVPPPNWFRWPAAVLILIVIILQWSAFIRTVYLQKKGKNA